MISPNADHPTLRRATWCFVIMATLMTFGLLARDVAAQDGWSRPELIYETSESIDSPYLFSDSFGITHLLWRETSRNVNTSAAGLETIFYTNDQDERWSTGYDIVAGNTLAGPRGAVDDNGVIHLIWTGQSNTLYHSLANIESARSALGWVEPVAIGTSNLNAHIVVDSERIAHVVFPGTDSAGAYYVRYDVDRDTWSFPNAVSATARADTSADYTRLAIGPDGTLHIVWTEFLLPEGWPPTGIYYAHSTDDGASWSRPVELAAENRVQANVAVDTSGIVHVAWNGVVGIGGRYHIWSDDNGSTWSEPVAVVEAGLGGTEGPPQLAVDTGGTLHFLSTFNGCAQYAAWKDGEWTEPVCISGREAMASGYIEQPALTITNGNELHAVFWDDRARLWHTSKTVDAAFIEPVSRPAPVLSEASVAIATSTPRQAVSQPAMDLSSAAPQPNALFNNPARALLPAVLAALAIIGLVLLIKVIRTR